MHSVCQLFVSWDQGSANLRSRSYVEFIEQSPELLVVESVIVKRDGYTLELGGKDLFIKQLYLNRIISTMQSIGHSNHHTIIIIIT